MEKVAAVFAAGLLLITFFAYRGYVNSRQALTILDLLAEVKSKVGAIAYAY